MSEPVLAETPSVPKRYRPTGERTGLAGFAAAALLREGVSQNKVSQLSGLSYDTVAAIHKRFKVAFEHIEPIRKSYRDLAMLMGAELLWNVDLKKLDEIPEEKKIELAMKLLDKYAAPERSEQPPWAMVLNQYNITPSHSASQRTIERQTPQPIESSASEVKQLNELEVK